jgi:hypothetical protein
MTALDRDWSTARVTFHRPGQQRPCRGLWATWLDDRLVWSCHVAGEGMRPRSFSIARQGWWRRRLSETAWMPLTASRSFARAFGTVGLMNAWSRPFLVINSTCSAMVLWWWLVGWVCGLAAKPRPPRPPHQFRPGGL